jgi:hypothetical protein
MGWIPLEALRDQVGLDPQDTSHDDKLRRYAAAAEKVVENFLNRRVYPDEVVSSEGPPDIPEDDETGILVDEQIRAAGIVIAAEMMENREAPRVLSDGVVSLLYPYRIGLGI